jgi:uncharacterized membrane protein (UPF0127 family)
MFLVQNGKLPIIAFGGTVILSGFSTRLFKLVVMLMVMAGAFGAGRAEAQAFEPLTIVTSTGRHTFQVEVMRTPEQRAKGLMHRQFMPSDRGMLFDFGRVEPVAMWMQNTYIPLDMFFIAATGQIVRITERTEPLSTRTLPSGEPVLSVLELNGGAAEKIGAKVGDVIEHPLFRR